MVHALREASRALVPTGALLDLRPLSAHFPIDAMTGSGIVRLGDVDSTAAMVDDAAADRALDEQVDRGELRPLGRRAFEMCLYWETAPQMAEFLRTGRPKIVTPSAAEIEAARAALAARAGAAVRLRATRRMTIGWYGTGRP